MNKNTVKKPQEHTKISLNKLELLVTVVNRAKADSFADQIQSFGANVQMIMYGRGTANQEMLNMLGLVDSQKAVIFSIITEAKVKAALDGLTDMFNSVKGGRGIAYTIPFSSIIGTSMFSFLSDNRSQVRRS